MTPRTAPIVPQRPPTVATPTGFSEAEAALLASHRVGHLATASSAGDPHVIPVCFAFDGARVFIALDAKPKQVEVRRLKRVRNILANPNVAFLVDSYGED